jgi:RNA recognition motif-containing protein
VRDRDTGQPRGFAFLEMTNDGEAEKAIHAMDGTVLGGRTLTVNEARSKPARSRGDELRTRGIVSTDSRALSGITGHLPLRGIPL